MVSAPLARRVSPSWATPAAFMGEPAHGPKLGRPPQASPSAPPGAYFRRCGTLISESSVRVRVSLTSKGECDEKDPAFRRTGRVAGTHVGGRFHPVRLGGALVRHHPRDLLRSSRREDRMHYHRWLPQQLPVLSGALALQAVEAVPRIQTAALSAASAATIGPPCRMSHRRMVARSLFSRTPGAGCTGRGSGENRLVRVSPRSSLGRWEERRGELRPPL
jgi:hypothetical protein